MCHLQRFPVYLTTHTNKHNCLFATLQIPVICGTIGATDQSVNKYARRNATCMCGACSATTILNAPALLSEILIRLFAYYLVFLFKIQLRLILLHFSYSFLQNNMTMHILSRQNGILEYTIFMNNFDQYRIDKDSNYCLQLKSRI